MGYNQQNTGLWWEELSDNDIDIVVLEQMEYGQLFQKILFKMGQALAIHENPIYFRAIVDLLEIYWVSYGT